MVEALKKTLGVITPAAELVGITRQTHYNWYNDDEEYHQEIDNIKEMAHDYVESKLYSGIKGGNTAMTIFYAKTQMKKRGYIETFTHQGREDELDRLEEPELDKQIKALEAEIAEIEKVESQTSSS